MKFIYFLFTFLFNEYILVWFYVLKCEFRFLNLIGVIIRIGSILSKNWKTFKLKFSKSKLVLNKYKICNFNNFKLFPKSLFFGNPVINILFIFYFLFYIFSKFVKLNSLYQLKFSPYIRWIIFLFIFLQYFFYLLYMFL